MVRREWERGPGPRLYALALGFFIGVVLGQVLASGMPGAAAMELREVLLARLLRDAPWRTDGSHGFAAASLFLRYPLLALLLRTAPAGGALLCGTAVIFGFSLSFSVGCFSNAFGRGGIALAAAAMGLRCLVTIPCFFLLAAPDRTALLCPPSSGVRTAGRGNALWVPLAVCGTALFLGIFLDLILTPRLLSWVAERVLI